MILIPFVLLDLVRAAFDLWDFQPRAQSKLVPPSFVAVVSKQYPQSC